MASLYCIRHGTKSDLDGEAAELDATSAIVFDTKGRSTLAWVGDKLVAKGENASSQLGVHGSSLSAWDDVRLPNSVVVTKIAVGSHNSLIITGAGKVLSTARSVDRRERRGRPSSRRGASAAGAKRATGAGHVICAPSPRAWRAYSLNLSRARHPPCNTP